MQVGRFQELSEKLGLAPMRKPALVGVAIVLVLVAVLAAGRCSYSWFLNASYFTFHTAHRQIVFAHTAKLSRRFFKGNSITCVFACQHEVMKFSKIF